ncbi:MAG: class I SAM-dependent methyltransferase [Porticoccaceae bacterium]
MSNKSITLTAELYRYLLEVSLREPVILRDLRAETAKLAAANMQIAPDQGQFMALLLRLMGARRVIEIGTFTGYSALVMALALPADGELIACDISADYTAVARRYWHDAGVAHKIDLRLAPAADTLRGLAAAGRQGEFDFVFIDADKAGYRDYYELSLPLLRQGGLVVVDNVLWNGSVIDTDRQDADTVAIRAFNQAVHGDERVEISMIPVGDGLTLLQKR